MDKCLLHALMVGEEWEHGGKVVGRWLEGAGISIGNRLISDASIFPVKSGLEIFIAITIDGASKFPALFHEEKSQ